jgi:simple sugar transport system substrate-binding protein
MSKNLSGARLRAPPLRLHRRAWLQSAAASLAWPWAAARSAEPLVAAFLYPSPIGDAGWSHRHELGRRQMERALGGRVRSFAIESVAEGPDAERVMRDAIRTRNARLVVAASFGYLEPALRVASDHPEVRFEHAGGYKRAPNLSTYDGRWYEARWLAGFLCGRMSRSGVAGYVAGFPVPEVVQGIDAFALGMRAARPGAEVRVLWLDTWFDPPKEGAAARALIDAGADVLTHHSGSTAVAAVAQQAFRDGKGTRVVPYPSDMRAVAPEAQLACVVHHWGERYAAVAARVLDGSWRSEAAWDGIAAGRVDIDAVAPDVPPAVRGELAAQRDAIVSRRLQPFAGRLVDNRGTVRLASGALDDARIRTLDWFVEGVVGSVPR